MTRWMTAFVVAALVGLSLAPADAVATHAVRRAPDRCVTPFRDRPMTGRSCRTASGALKVRVGDGFALTHGPDKASDISPVKTLPATVAGVCSPAPEYRIQLIYAVAYDRPDRYSELKPEIQQMFAAADADLNANAQRLGYQAHYRVDCSTEAEVRTDSLIPKPQIGPAITVSHAVLPTKSTDDNWSTITRDLGLLQYNDKHVKYWVFYDEDHPVYGGQGQGAADDTLGAFNDNNDGPSFAIDYGYTGPTGAGIFVHEGAHALGAVQNSAPNASGWGHCNDEQDRMCGNDGGPTNVVYWTCNDGIEHYDCNHNDYFHTNPPAGNYLATHWNIGSCFDNFIVNNYCDGGLPTVNAGPDKHCVPGQTCWIDGASASDPSGLSAYEWTWESCIPVPCVLGFLPRGSISGTSINFPAFSVPAFAGVYTLRLKVWDVEGRNMTDTITVIAP